MKFGVSLSKLLIESHSDGYEREEEKPSEQDVRRLSMKSQRLFVLIKDREITSQLYDCGTRSFLRLALVEME